MNSYNILEAGLQDIGQLIHGYYEENCPVTQRRLDDVAGQPIHLA